eukprot:3497461-Prymnesium_polylepis.1
MFARRSRSSFSWANTRGRGCSCCSGMPGVCVCVCVDSHSVLRPCAGGRVGHLCDRRGRRAGGNGDSVHLRSWVELFGCHASAAHETSHTK